MNTYDTNMSDNVKIKTYKSKKKMFCNNCGKYSHYATKCREPIISIGLINFKLDMEDETEKNRLVKHLDDKYGEHVIDKNGYKHIITPLNNSIKYNRKMDLGKFYMYKDSINFLLICRKNTLGYIEFVRGHYRLDDGGESIISLFEQMMKEEIEMIEKHNIEYLWKNLWATTCNNKTYENEFKQSKKKFNDLKYGNNIHNLYFYTRNVHPKYETPEWGFPKGRRNFHEKNIHCAKREFQEESGYDASDYKLLNRLHSLNEVFLGTDDIKYKHIYYISTALNDKPPLINKSNPSQFEEIGNIGWFTFDQAMKLIRPYHTQRKKILTQFYMFLLNEFISHVE